MKRLLTAAATAAVAFGAGLLDLAGTPPGAGGGPGQFGASVASAMSAGPTVTLTLRDGRVIRGTLVRELEGNFWVRHRVGNLEVEGFFAASEVSNVEREAGAAAAPSEPVRVDQPATAPARRPGVPRAAVITVGDRENGDFVGTYVTAHALRQIIPMLEKELGTDRSGIVVLRVTSGGGSVREMFAISELIHEEYKPRFRTVAWIDEAISAAAMLSHTLEEIYFTPQGRYGAATMFRGAGEAAEGLQLEHVLIRMEQISEQGRHNPLIMRSMQVDDPLSVTVDENGNAQFFADETSGRILVNRRGSILTLTSKTAEQIRFSQGTASTLDELTRALGFTEIEWVGNRVPGVAWPVSQAEAWTMRYRAQTRQDETRSQEYTTRYQRALAEARAAQNRQLRGQFVNLARQALAELRRMARNNPNTIMYVLNIETQELFQEWLREQDDTLRDLMR